MAWYRVGGGGLPPQIKTDMNNVLNKKFGTSTTYPPNEWASDVNLLGALEEKTVSATIAVIEDGADDVPTKSVKITLPASLDGYSGVEVVNDGRNLADMDNFEIGTFQENKPSGTAYDDMKSSNNTRSRIKTLFPIPSGSDLTISCASDYDVFTTYFDADGLYLGQYQSWTKSRTVSRTNGYFVAIAWRKSNNGTIQPSDFENVHLQIELGSTASAYTPYIAPTTYTATLGRTIYGGEVDIVNGVGQAQFAYHKLTSDDTIYMYNSANGFLVGTSTFAEGEMVALSNSGGLCNAFDTVTTSTNTGVRFGMSNNSNIYFVQVQSIMGSTLQDIKDYIDNHDIYVVYRLATPTDFTFTGQEVPTRLGYNCFISEQGDTSVAYRASGTIYQYPKGEEASF